MQRISPSLYEGKLWLTSPAGQRWLARALLLYALIGFFVWIRRPGDFAGYIAVGEVVLSGGHLYRDTIPGQNTWPPFFSLLCVPLAGLAAVSPYLARGLWLLLNFALVVWVLDVIARMLYGRALSLRQRPDRVYIAAPELLVPLLLSDRYVSGNFDHIQVNIVIFALALAGLGWQRRGREVLGSVVLGLGAALKVMPAVVIPYLCYRRQWRAAALTTLATAACSLSPMLVFGWSRFWDYVSAWRDALQAGWGVGKMNQSVFAMWDRFLGHGILPFAGVGVNELPESGSALVTMAVAATLAIVVGGMLMAFRSGAPRDDWEAVAEWSVLFIVAAIFGPVAWKAYLVVLLLPNAVLFAAWRSGRLKPIARRRAGWVLVVALVLTLTSMRGFVGKRIAGTLEMTSFVTLAALTLLSGTLWLRATLGARHPPRASSI
jgi:hypothetical protein